MANTTGYAPDGTPINYNPAYFATQDVANQMAQLLGGKVVQGAPFPVSASSPFKFPQTYMVQLPNGQMINPALESDSIMRAQQEGFLPQYQASMQRDFGVTPNLQAMESMGQPTQSSAPAPSPYTPPQVSAPPSIPSLPSLPSISSYVPPATGNNYQSPSIGQPSQTSSSQAPSGYSPQSYASDYPAVNAPNFSQQMASPFSMQNANIGQYGASLDSTNLPQFDPGNSSFNLAGWQQSLGDTQNMFPLWGTATGSPYLGGDPGQMAQSEANRATDYGNMFQNVFGQQYLRNMNLGSAYQNQADSAYNQLAAQPGYSPSEAQDILQYEMTMNGMTSPQDFQSNYLTPQEMTDIRGNPQSIIDAYNPANVEGIASTGANAAQGRLNNYSQSALGAIDPSKLRMSDAEVERLKDQAGRQIGLQYSAIQDKLTRDAAAAGQTNPLSLAAAKEDIGRQSAIQSANAVTDADIAARNAQRQAESNLANMTIGANATFGGLQAGLDTTSNAQKIGAGEWAGNTAISQAAAADQLAAQRAYQQAQNRQQMNLNNQQQKYQQNYYNAAALGQRNQSIANQRIQGQQAARNYWQSQGQFNNQQANVAGQGMLSGAQTSLGGQGQGGQIAMGTEIGRRQTRPVTIGTGGISIGL